MRDHYGRNVIFVNEEAKVFFVNTKYGDKEFKGFRKTKRLSVGEEKHLTTQLIKNGYEKKYVGDFENLMI